MKARRQKFDLKAIKRQFPARAADIDMFESMQDAVYSVTFEAPPAANPEELREAFASGRAVLDTGLAALDAPAFVSALTQLFRLLERVNPQEFGNATRKQIPETLMSRYLSADASWLTQYAQEHGISSQALISCCQQAARPQLVALREANSGEETGLRAQGHCPFCGALPAMAEIETTGIRCVFCPNCLARYRISRHYCPGCGHAGLNMLKMDSWPELILESCPECHAYLKTWSLGAGQPPCPFPYFDIVTRDVDEAAGRQNMKRLSLSVMGV